MAKICMLTTVTPHAWSDMRQFYRQAPALADDGHKVIFIAGDPGKKGTDRFEFSVLSERRRKMVRFTGGLNLCWYIIRLRPAVVQLCSVEQLLLGLVLKAFTYIKVIYDCREDMPLSMRHKDRWPSAIRWIMSHFTRFVECLAACTFDGIIASDPAVFKMHRAMPNRRKMIFFNTPPLSLFKRDYLPLAQRKYDVVVMGSMTTRSGVVPFIEAIGLLRQRGYQISVLLLGQPDKFVIGTVQEMIRQFGIEEQVTITGIIPHDQVPAVLAWAKVGVVPLLDMPKFHRNIACKAFEYMACGMPVISSDLPPERLFIKHRENGLFSEPGNVEQLAGAIVSMLEDLPRAQAMGEAGRNEIEREWNSERNQEELKKFYRRILTGKPRFKIRNRPKEGDK